MPDDTTPDGAVPEMPHRELRDPRALRAVAHPLRLTILERLAFLGPSTATELAEHLQDQSPANCSWHLRQLAQYGFIEEAESGPGRQRRWRIVPESTSVPDDESPELAVAADAFDQVLLDRALDNRQAWQASRRAEPQQWRDASFSSHSWAWLTADELAQLKTDLHSLIDRRIVSLMDRFDPSNRPAGSRPVQLLAWAVPAGPEVDGEPTIPPDSQETTS